jgi:hypothetical protein
VRRKRKEKKSGNRETNTKTEKRIEEKGIDSE